MLLNHLKDNGFKECFLSVGYLGNKIIDRYGEFYKGLSIQYNIESCPLGTGGALKDTFKNFYPKFKNENIFILNGDSFMNIESSEYSRLLLSENPTIVVKSMDNVERYGHILFDNNNYITQFCEKGFGGKGYINSGCYIFKSDFLVKNFPKENKFSFENMLIPNLVKKHKIKTFISHKDFIDIGTIESYKKAANFFKNLK